MAGPSQGLGYNYTHITGAATTNITTGIGATQGSATSPGNVGILGYVCVNTAGTTVTVNDGSVTIGVIGAVTGVFLLNIQLKNSLSIVTVGSTTDVTVAWA
jgi:hypothetical protein